MTRPWPYQLFDKAGSLLYSDDFIGYPLETYGLINSQYLGGGTNTIGKTVIDNNNNLIFAL